ncbi:type II toxin-antitoxin system RelE/ParE family toxin [Candidatus Pacearchaeota archaeon]|nr:type II toxin-antitoxin system RelE/ParE family toxin [Candidatus Pacearchaeota archaeon]
MYPYNYSERLKGILKKLFKKDNKTYNQIMKKVQEIINSVDVEHYKNLKYDLKEFKGVHIGHFVLVFKYDKNQNIISFEDFDHHDKIYFKKYN